MKTIRQICWLYVQLKYIIWDNGIKFLLWMIDTHKPLDRRINWKWFR